MLVVLSGIPTAVRTEHGTQRTDDIHFSRT